MRIIYLYITFTIVIVNTSTAQLINTFLITNSDSVYGCIPMSPRSFDLDKIKKLQNKVVYYDEHRKKYKPHFADIVEFYLFNSYDTIRMINLIPLSKGSTIFPPVNFAHCILETNNYYLVRVYYPKGSNSPLTSQNYHTIQSNRGKVSNQDRMQRTDLSIINAGYTYNLLIFDKEKSMFMRNRGGNVKKNCLEFFKDCPYLIEGLKDDSLNPKDFKHLLYLYERFCTSE